VLDIPADHIEASPHYSSTQGGNFVCGMGKVGDEIKMIIDVNQLLFRDNELLEKIAEEGG
jgi:chemotaxis signal transduction protein